MTDFDKVNERIAQLRAQTTDDASEQGFEPADLDPDPFVQFMRWLEDALEAHPGWPNAMTLATADAEGRPSARTVLLKSVDRRGFTFFTNYESRKGRELQANRRAALLFYWPKLERQVAIRGEVVLVERDEAEEYFRTRPRGSRLGAWASPQSRVIGGRDELEDRVRDLDAEFGDEVPLPSHWGGFRLVPVAFEFWKSRPNRLHDRVLYSPEVDGWKRERLAP